MGDLKRFGDYIRDLRGDRSQDDLATPVGMTGSGWSLIENASREPKLSTLVKMAKALKVTPASLISVYEGESYSPEGDSQEIESSIVDFVSHLPDRIMLKALCSKPEAEVFDKLLAVKGEAKMRELMQEVLRRQAEKGQKE